MAGSPALAEDVILLTMGKNKANETFITRKETFNAKTKMRKKFVDFREWWYANGPEEPPVATRKGTMIHRQNLPKLIECLLKELNADDDNVDAEFINLIMELAQELGDAVDDLEK